MSTKTPKNNEEQEIDFEQISNKIGGFIKKGNSVIFDGIVFLIKNKISLLVLLIFGFSLGLFLDQISKTYSNEIIVSPNFGSTDYLYSKVDLLTSKVKEKDTVFLKSIGIQDPTNLSKIGIEPIVDVYKFVSFNEQNLELLKLMAENGDLKTIVKENSTSKNYPFHLISLKTKSQKNSKPDAQAILSYLNNSQYFKEIQKVSIENIQQKIKADEVIINQIDGILNSFSKNSSDSSKSDKLVYYNENTQLNDVIKTKETLTKELGDLKLELLKSDKIIKENTIVLNLQDKNTLNNKLKFILPLLFILGFVLFAFFRKFYKNQLRLSALNS